MIRVLIRAPSPVARAGLESLIRLDPLLHIIEESPENQTSDSVESATARHSPGNSLHRFSSGHGFSRAAKNDSSSEVSTPEAKGRNSHVSHAPIEDREPDVIVTQIENSSDGRAGKSTFSSSLTNDPSGIPLIFLVPGDVSDWNYAFRQGARAVLSSRTSGEQIVAAIHAVTAGLYVFQPSESENFLEDTFRESPERLAEPLTAREIEVLRLMALGLANKEIASRLNISEHTAKFHVASVMGKLGAENRTEAVMSGVQHGLVLI
jgi:DNA-binding NarL/FixJ family response regulator